MKPRERFAINLRKARKKKGISQEELGFLCDLHRTEISLLERGGREPGSARSSSCRLSGNDARTALRRESPGSPARSRYQFKK